MRAHKSQPLHRWEHLRAANVPKWSFTKLLFFWVYFAGFSDRLSHFWALDITIPDSETRLSSWPPATAGRRGLNVLFFFSPDGFYANQYWSVVRRLYRWLDLCFYMKVLQDCCFSSVRGSLVWKDLTIVSFHCSALQKFEFGCCSCWVFFLSPWWLNTPPPLAFLERREARVSTQINESPSWTCFCWVWLDVFSHIFLQRISVWLKSNSRITVATYYRQSGFKNVLLLLLIIVMQSVFEWIEWIWINDSYLIYRGESVDGCWDPELLSNDPVIKPECWWSREPVQRP